MSVRKSSGLNRVEKRGDTNTYQDEVFGTVPPFTWKFLEVSGRLLLHTTAAVCETACRVCLHSISIENEFPSCYVMTERGVSMIVCERNVTLHFLPNREKQAQVSLISVKRTEFSCSTL